MNPKIHIIHNNILLFPGDCIISPANSTLIPGKGLEEKIHMLGGPTIAEYCKKYNECKPGNAVISTAGKLPFKYIIHAVGPFWKGGQDNEKTILKQAYQKCFKIAEEYRIQSIAFPNISTGIFGFPKETAGEIVLNVVQNLKTTCIKDISFYCFDTENFSVYQKLFTEKKADSF